ncbi:MAG: haloacid dehalogenase [Chloroflexi bacterium RBG_16_63_12]|nr:MAG: haloacid dehalogenase [Chloroflexi bacterium RBG_16_63_12]
MESIHDLRAFIVDMDGVLWEGDRPMPGLADFFQTLRERRIKFVLATNNASKTPEQYVSKLAGMGVTVAREEILTSAQAAALYLRQQSANGTKVFAIGEDGVRQALAETGFTLTGLYEVDAQFVVCGMDRGLSWDKLATATLNVRAGARFIGTNPDVTFPTERGITHGNGAVLAAIQAATGVAPIIIGKPEPIMYQLAMTRLGVAPAETAAIGDRLETDILGAVRARIRSVFVLSGVSSRGQLAGLDYQPTWVMQDIREVTKALR